MGLTTKLNATLGLTFSSTVGGQTVQTTPSFTFSDSLADGVIVDTADVAWFNSARALGATTSEDLDVTGSLSDAFGATITQAKIKCVYIKNLNTAVGDILEVGGASSNQMLLFKGATDIYEVGPGGLFLIWNPSLAGHAVTASTGDLLKLNNTGSNSMTFDIVIIGTSS